MADPQPDLGSLVPSVIAVLGAIVVLSFLDQALELTLVNAVAGEPVHDAASYFSVRNQPGVLAGKIGYTAVIGLLAGYLCAKVAGRAEIGHAALAAGVQSLLLLRAMFGSGEFAAFTPWWLWLALIGATVPAMLLGANVRRRARLAAPPAPAAPDHS